MLVSFFSLLAWDGFLPVFTAAVPFFLRTFFPEFLWIAVLLPLVNVMVRAGIGEQQIRNVCLGKAPIFRQLVLVVAILVLFVLDILLSSMMLNKQAPPEFWKLCIALYGAYLLLVCIALRPVRISGASRPEPVPMESHLRY